VPALLVDARYGASAADDPAPPSKTVRAQVFDQEGKLVGPIELPTVVLPPAEWRKRLPGQAFKVLRTKGTEAPFTGALLANKTQGIYTCAGCGLPLFSSQSKFESGTGWPSFYQPIAKENISESVDNSAGMVRTEITCPRCGGHLGHVFNDGPQPTGLRYCLNSVCLTFTPDDKVRALADPRAKAAPPQSQGK
jgi:methionine-R-sulfoxide reductase